MVYKYEFEIIKRDPLSFKSTPIIINNYNRLDCLDKLINRLKIDGYKNIYIIDNNSSYKPLLSYYEKNNLRIFRLNQNIGYLAVWLTNIYKIFINDYYVYTDPDVLPDPDCPSNYLEVFRNYLKYFPNLDKVGFSLRIDNLPAHCRLKDEVIKHEEKFWKLKISDNLYDAPIDTTFALYRPGAYGEAAKTKSGRTGFPYVAQHLPWYLNHKKLTEEEIWYLKCKKTETHWSDHLSNFSILKKYYLLFINNQIPQVWTIRSIGKKVINWIFKKEIV